MARGDATAVARRHPLLAFTALAYLLSWSAWLPLLAARQGWINGHVPQWWHLVGSLGPLTAAVWVTAIVHGRAGVADLVRRCVTVPERARVWVIGAVAAPVAVCLLALALAGAAGQAPDLSGFGASEEFASIPRLAFWGVSLVFYGFGEEVGWRGFALPHLQRSSTGLSASLRVGLIWGIWHLPLFGVAPGLSTMPAFALLGWGFSIVTASIVFTWLYNGSGGSILAVALFHACFDVLLARHRGRVRPPPQ